MTTLNGYALPHPESEDYIADPATQLAEIIAWLRRSADPNRPRITFGVESIDESVMITDQDLVVIAGRPSMGKSQLVKWLARREAARLAQLEEPDGFVLFVTLEEPSVKVALHVHDVPIDRERVRRGDFDLAEAERLATRVLDQPVQIVRHPGMVGHGENRRLADPISADTIQHAVERLTATTRRHQRPTLVCLDYLQLLRPAHGRLAEKTRVAEVIAATEGAKLIASAFECPVVMAVQSARETDKRKPPLPEMADMQWGSVIEQAADTVLGVLRPVRHEMFDPDPATGHRPMLPFKGHRYHVDDDLFLVSVIKQKDAEGRSQHVAALDVRTCTLADHPDTPLVRVAS